ncbi:unnamed protein product, partial [Dibothriocephalus latus]
MEKVVANAKASTTTTATDEPGPSKAPKRQRLWIEHLDGVSSDDSDDSSRSSSSSSAEAPPKSDSVPATATVISSIEKTPKEEASGEKTDDTPTGKPKEPTPSSAAAAAASPTPASKLEPVPSQP